jgi:hypothetical protein
MALRPETKIRNIVLLYLTLPVDHGSGPPPAAFGSVSGSESESMNCTAMFMDSGPGTPMDYGYGKMIKNNTTSLMDHGSGTSNSSGSVPKLRKFTNSSMVPRSDFKNKKLVLVLLYKKFTKKALQKFEFY